MWVRGLKLNRVDISLYDDVSHPMWVRGLKHAASDWLLQICLSHPMWVRGLKLIVAIHPYHEVMVAPHVGAWIETYLRNLAKADKEGRTPCGCVD